MPRHARLLGVRVKLLVELLPRPQTREDDLHVLSLAQPGKPDQLPREIHDEHLLAHVEQEYLPPATHGGRLQHQAHRLGDGHEVAARLRVRDRDRPAALELTLEERDHRAVAAEHVPEPDRDEARPARARPSLEQHLAQPLRCAHHARRVDRLVGRDEHELVHAVGLRGVHHHSRAEHVVEHRFARVGLEQRHVLVSCGMEHDRRAEAAERQIDAGRILDVGHHSMQRQAGPRGCQLGVHEVEPVLGVVEKDELLGIELRGLARELGAHGAAGPGHQHTLSLEERRQLGGVEAHGLAAQQVFDAHVAHLRD